MYPRPLGISQIRRLVRTMKPDVLAEVKTTFPVSHKIWVLEDEGLNINARSPSRN
jgi:hypothetical protein